MDTMGEHGLERRVGWHELGLRRRAAFESLADRMTQRGRRPALWIRLVARAGAIPIMLLVGPELYVLSARCPRGARDGGASAFVESWRSGLLTVLGGGGYGVLAWALRRASELALTVGGGWLAAVLASVMAVLVLVVAALGVVQLLMVGKVAFHWWRFPEPITHYVHDLVRWKPRAESDKTGDAESDKTSEDAESGKPGEDAESGKPGEGAVLQGRLMRRFPGHGLDAANEKLVKKVYAPVGMRRVREGRLSMMPGPATETAEADFRALLTRVYRPLERSQADEAPSPDDGD